MRVGSGVQLRWQIVRCRYLYVVSGELVCLSVCSQSSRKVTIAGALCLCAFDMFQIAASFADARFDEWSFLFFDLSTVILETRLCCRSSR